MFSSKYLNKFKYKGEKMRVNTQHRPLPFISRWWGIGRTPQIWDSCQGHTYFWGRTSEEILGEYLNCRHMIKEVSPVRFLDVLPTCHGKVMDHTQAEDEAKMGVRHWRQRILEPK